MDELLQEFIAETRETLEALSGEIVAWEADPAERGRLDAIFRFVHTVKGSCGFLDLPRLARLSHAAEDALAAVRSGERRPDKALVDAVLAIVDRIGEIVEAIAGGLPLDDTGEDLLIAALGVSAPCLPALTDPTLAPATATGGDQPAAPRVAARSVRLGVELLDRMMSGMSDMVLARNELARSLRDRAPDPGVEAALERLSATVADMRDTVTRTRMQKIEALFSALPRMVRDTAATLGKAVLLQVDGSNVELDREMVELMRDPLVHIIRNAIDHGIEPAADRRRTGKRETGRLTVAARQSGNQIIIEIADDGRGIDTGRLIAKLAATGHASEAELRQLSPRAKLDLIFHPGLSSKDEVTAISGRGVGMDAVRANVEQVGGRIELCNLPGRGLTVSIHVPLTLSIISTVIVGAGGQRFALPRQAVEEIVALRGDAVRLDLVGDAAVATVRDRRLPLVSLAEVLGMGDHAAPYLAIVGTRDGTYALAVDTVFDTEELVVKPAAPAVMAAGVFAGQTLPDSGRPMLLLDATGVSEAAGLRFESVAAIEEEAAEPAAPRQDALLFIDLDGQRRAVSLAVVDRVETVPVHAIRRTAGRLRMIADGRAVPLVTAGDIPGSGSVAVLRLHDGQADLGYVVSEAVNIAGLPPEMVPAASPGPIAGVVVLDGEQVELLDPFWLFASGAAPAVAAAPLCLLQPDPSGWLRHFLRPALEAAGYRVASELPPGMRADVELALDGSACPATAPLVTLAAVPVHAGDTRVYRYDRAAVLAALAHRLEEARAA